MFCRGIFVTQKNGSIRKKRLVSKLVISKPG